MDAEISLGYHISNLIEKEFQIQVNSSYLMNTNSSKKSQ